MEANHSLVNKVIGKGKNIADAKPVKKSESHLVKITKEEIETVRPRVYKYLLP